MKRLTALALFYISFSVFAQDCFSTDDEKAQLACLVDKYWDENQIANKASIGCRKQADIYLELPPVMRDVGLIYSCIRNLQELFDGEDFWDADFNYLIESAEESKRELSDKEREFLEINRETHKNYEYIKQALSASNKGQLQP